MLKKFWIICLFSLFLSVCFCFLWQWADEKPSDVPHKQNVKSVGQSVGGAKENEEKYYICTEDGNNICAYILKESEKILVKQTPLNHETLPEGELKMLRNGIYVGSYEEMCICFEAYIS